MASQDRKKHSQDLSSSTASAAAAEAVQAAEKGGIDPTQFAKILSDPIMAALSSVPAYCLIVKIVKK